MSIKFISDRTKGWADIFYLSLATDNSFTVTFEKSRFLLSSRRWNVNISYEIVSNMLDCTVLLSFNKSSITDQYEQGLRLQGYSSEST